MDKKCKYCKQIIDKKATVCPFCRKNQGIGCGTVFATIIILLIGLYVFVQCSGIADGYNEASENAQIASEAEQIPEADYKAQCKTVSYEEIARHKYGMSGEKLTFTGIIIQATSGRYRMNITQTDFGYVDDIIFDIDENILNKNILEGDKVTIWGESKGLYTYEAVLGNAVTVPRIQVAYIDNQGQN